MIGFLVLLLKVKRQRSEWALCIGAVCAGVLNVCWKFALIILEYARVGKDQFAPVVISRRRCVQRLGADEVKRWQVDLIKKIETTPWTVDAGQHLSANSSAKPRITAETLFYVCCKSIASMFSMSNTSVVKVFP